MLRRLGYTNADVSAAEARILTVTRESRSAKSETTAASDATLRGQWRADALRGGLDSDALMDRVLAAYWPRIGQQRAAVHIAAELLDEATVREEIVRIYSQGRAPLWSKEDA